jgi:hypothetical protein
VNLLVTLPGSTATSEEGQPTTENGTGEVFAQPARVLYQKVQILAVGQTRKLEPGETAATNADGTPAAAATSGLITFVVPADAAQRIASVDPAGFYLTLVAKDYQPEALGPLDTSEVLPAEDSGRLTPYGPDGRPES